MTDIDKPDKVEAYRRAATIRAGVQGFAEAKVAIAEAYEAHDWITLGYTSWGEYCKKEIGNRLKMPRGDRDLAIQAFSELGMSVREISESLDVAKSTVQDALKPPAPRASGSGQHDQLEPQVNDPLTQFPAVEAALEDFHKNKTSPDPAVPEDGEEDAADPGGSAASSVPPNASGPAATSPAGGSGENHPDGEPGEAEGDGAPAADVNTPSVPQTGEDSSPVESLPVYGPERAADAGVSLPSAPVPAKNEDDPERVEHEMRTRMSERFCEAIVTLSQGFASGDPIWWLEEMYLPGAYKMRGLPGVNECFDPESLRLLAARIHMIADHRDETGMKLP